MTSLPEPPAKGGTLSYPDPITKEKPASTGTQQGP